MFLQISSCKLSVCTDICHSEWWCSEFKTVGSSSTSYIEIGRAWTSPSISAYSVPNLCWRRRQGCSHLCAFQTQSGSRENHCFRPKCGPLLQVRFIIFLVKAVKWFTFIVHRLKIYLQQFGIPSCALNSELPINSRCHIVQQFNAGMYDIIIASDELSLDDPNYVAANKSNKIVAQISLPRNVTS